MPPNFTNQILLQKFYHSTHPLFPMFGTLMVKVYVRIIRQTQSMCSNLGRFIIVKNNYRKIIIIGEIKNVRSYKKIIEKKLNRKYIIVIAS